MNTPAHLILGMAAFSKRDAPKITAAAFIGALLPDLSLYLLAGWSLFIAQIPPETVFGEMYFSDAWMRVFRVDNSFVIWGAILAFGMWRKSAVIIALAGAALLHIALDFPLHHDDGRPHFWPLSDWIFESPFSYWDRGHGATWIAPLETLLVVIAAVVLLRRHLNWPLRLGIIALTVLQLAPVFVWVFVFASGG